MANETEQVCTRNLGQISCSFNFLALLPVCAYKSEILCDRSAASEIHNIKLNFTLVLETDYEPHEFSGTIQSENGDVFLLENKDFRSIWE